MFWDTKIADFGLRVTAAGAHSYIFESRLFGRTVRTTIGDAKAWELGKARIEAGRLRGLVDNGMDPREHRAEQQAAHDARRVEAKRRDVTVGEAWDKYVSARAASWGHLHYRDHLRHAEEGGKLKKRGEGLTRPGPIAALRPVRLAELTSGRIALWLAFQAEQRPTMVALSFRLLRAFVRWCADTPAFRGVVPADAYTARDVKEAVPRVRPKEGDSLQREQLPAWFAAVRALPNSIHSVYLQGLLITGARREELASVRWSCVDLRWRSLTLDDKVEGTGGRTIPLPPYLAGLLEELKRRNDLPPSPRRCALLEARAPRANMTCATSP